MGFNIRDLTRLISPKPRYTTEEIGEMIENNKLDPIRLGKHDEKSSITKKIRKLINIIDNEILNED